MKFDKSQPHRPNPADIGDDLELLAAAGKALFGEHWQSPTAALCGISRSHMSGIVSKTKALTPRTKSKFVDALNNIREQIQEDARYRVRIVAEAIMRFSED